MFFVVCMMKVYMVFAAASLDTLVILNYLNSLNSIIFAAALKKESK